MLPLNVGPLLLKVGGKISDYFLRTTALEWWQAWTEILVLYWTFSLLCRFSGQRSQLTGCFRKSGRLRSCFLKSISRIGGSAWKTIVSLISGGRAERSWTQWTKPYVRYLFLPCPERCSLLFVSGTEESVESGQRLKWIVRKERELRDCWGAPCPLPWLIGGRPVV